MSKTHFLLNRQLLVALAIIIGVIVMLIVNTVVLVPILEDVFIPETETAHMQPIETAVVDQALELLHAEKQ